MLVDRSLKHDMDFVHPSKEMGELLKRKMRQKREERLLLVSEHTGGESTAGDREGKWEVTEAVGNAKVRTLCVGESSLGCLLGSRWAS